MIKKLTKLFWLITLAAIIGFSFVSCDNANDRNDEDNDNDDNPFIGIWAGDNSTLICTGPAWIAEIYDEGSFSGACTYSLDYKSVIFTLTVDGKFGTAVVSGNTMNLYAKETEFTLIKNGIEMVSIPAGTFIMGSPTSETQHKVKLSGFKMGKYEVTQAQYRAVMGTREDRTFTQRGKGDNYPIYNVNWYDAIVFCNKLSIIEGLSPVYSIGGSTDPAAWIKNNGGSIPSSGNAIWNDAVMYKNKNGYRLPTEAEWEYACRAGTTTAYNTGNTISDNTGWYYGNSENKTHQVGLKSANVWGLYDMYGNVYEWCWDWYDSGYYLNSPTNNPTGASSGTYRVGRGGGWSSSAEDLRSASRSVGYPSPRASSSGFRLVRSF
ncbi:hypothetical protein R84B8_01996 [Treponema sp. R8-4-B8]